MVIGVPVVPEVFYCLETPFPETIELFTAQGAEQKRGSHEAILNENMEWYSFGWVISGGGQDPELLVAEHRTTVRCVHRGLRKKPLDPGFLLADVVPVKSPSCARLWGRHEGHKLYFAAPKTGIEVSTIRVVRRSEVQQLVGDVDEGGGCQNRRSTVGVRVVLVRICAKLLTFWKQKM